MKFTKKQLSQNLLDAFTTKYNSPDAIYSLEADVIKRKVEIFFKLNPLADGKVKEQSILFATKAYERMLPKINLQYFKDLIDQEVLVKSEDGVLEEKELAEYSDSTNREVIAFCFNQTIKIMRKERRKNRNK